VVTFRDARRDEVPRIVALGRTMIGWAIETARQDGCGLVQLTSGKRRAGAIRFYESLGFEASHEGLKLPLWAGARLRDPVGVAGHHLRPVQVAMTTLIPPE
jgi:hypothetical protein